LGLTLTGSKYQKGDELLHNDYTVIDDCLEDNREDYLNYRDHVNYICTRIMGVLTILGLVCFFVFCVSVKVNLLFHYYVFVCIFPEKAVPEMTYIVSGGTLNPTHSLTYTMNP